MTISSDLDSHKLQTLTISNLKFFISLVELTTFRTGRCFGIKHENLLIHCHFHFVLLLWVDNTNRRLSFINNTFRIIILN